MAVSNVASGKKTYYEYLDGSNWMGLKKSKTNDILEEHKTKG